MTLVAASPLWLDFPKQPAGRTHRHCATPPLRQRHWLGDDGLGDSPFLYLSVGAGCTDQVRDRSREDGVSLSYANRRGHSYIFIIMLWHSFHMSVLFSAKNQKRKIITKMVARK
jgi:hypothetical protein